MSSPRPADPKLVYVASPAHSGSTLLDLLVGGHDEVVSVGEAKRFRPGTGLPIPCSCGAPSIRRCTFWQRVEAGLRERLGCPLDGLDLASPDEATFVRHNQAFFRAVAQAANRPVVVDSSKSVERLRRLLASGRFDVVPVRLVRRPQGVVYSNVKKQRDWLDATADYIRDHRAARRLLRGTPHAIVIYERLVADPAAELTALMPRLGLSFDPAQLDWTNRERHNYGGNRMRRSPSAEIRLDTGWMDGLTRGQRLAIDVLTWRESAGTRRRGGLSSWQRLLLRLLRLASSRPVAR